MHLKRLYHGVLKGHEKRLLVSTSHPQSGRTELGARKLPLAEKFLPDDLQWLAKGLSPLEAAQAAKEFVSAGIRQRVSSHAPFDSLWQGGLAAERA